MGNWFRKLLTKILAWAITMLLLWAAWGIWLDYQERGSFETRRAVAVAVDQWREVPGMVGDWAGRFRDLAREIRPPSEDTGRPES